MRLIIDIFSNRNLFKYPFVFVEFLIDIDVVICKIFIAWNTLNNNSFSFSILSLYTLLLTFEKQEVV